MRLATPLLAVAVLVTGAHPVSAAGGIDAELNTAAKDIAKYLKARGANTVGIGQIRSTADEKISHGPGLALRLTEQLTGAGLAVKKDARYVIVGTYADKLDPKEKRVFIQLDLTVTDAVKGEKLVTLPRAIFGEDALIELLAPAAIAIPVSASREKREDIIVRAIDELRTKPRWVIDGTVVYASADKEYGVEFMVKGADGKFVGRAPKADDGDLVIDLKKGETFRFRLHNKSRYDAGVKVLIDGLNTFSFGAFQKMDPKPRWIVPAGRGAEIAGWPSGEGKSREFLVTDYAGSAVAELGGDGTKLGVLTVVFAATWPEGGPIPADEEKGGRNIAIGRGAEIDTPLNKVERVFGAARATISLRYNKK